jgi:hypothetical protein
MFSIKSYQMDDLAPLLFIEILIYCFLTHILLNIFQQVTSDGNGKENFLGSSSVTGENSTIFSSTPNTSSFSALGLGASTYSLFSTPSWVTPASTCGLELEGNSCGNGLSSVMGVPGNSSLNIGQQVRKYFSF